MQKTVIMLEYHKAEMFMAVMTIEQQYILYIKLQYMIWMCIHTAKNVNC